MTKDPVLRNLVNRLAELLKLVAKGETVSEAELVLTAQQTYEHLRIGADSLPDATQTRALVLLSTAPEHPALNQLRLRAQGAADMYARLASLALRASDFSLETIAEHLNLDSLSGIIDRKPQDSSINDVTRLPPPPNPNEEPKSTDSLVAPSADF